MSIATKHGDGGDTGLIGGSRVSKADVRVEAYGTVDELGASMGFARSICEDAEVRELTKSIQRELFTVAGAIASPKGGAESAGVYVSPRRRARRRPPGGDGRRTDPARRPLPEPPLRPPLAHGASARAARRPRH